MNRVPVTMISLLRYKPRGIAVLITALFLSGLRASYSQVELNSTGETSLLLRPNESKTVEVPGLPHSLQVLEVRLLGGLVGVRSAETTRRILDLGRGGRLLFAIEVPESGTAGVELTSGERLRNAELSIHLVTQDFTEDQRLYLHRAGIAFALADSTRRHQPHAPDAGTALKAYEESAAEALAAGDPSLARWALTQEGRFLLYQKSNFVQTRALLQRAAALPGSGDEAAQALLYKTLSSCEYFLGNLPESVSLGERALALYRATGDQYWQGVVLGNLLAGYGEMGRDGDAVLAGREALTDAEQTEDTAGVVFCLTELANLYRKQGSLQMAFSAFREAQSWSEDIRYAPLVQAEIEQELGHFYMELGLWDEAEAQLKRCLEHASPNGASALEARGLLALTAERHGDLPTSLREYDRAIATARELKLGPQEARLLLDRSAALLKAHRAAAALEDARSALRLADELQLPTLRTQASLAEGAACLEACSNPLDSAKIYRTAIDLMGESGEREQEAAAYVGLARVDVALKNDEAALEASQRGLSLLEHSRASLASHSLAATYFQERRSWYELAIDIAARLDRSHPGSGYAEKAFELAERSRARAVLDALGDAAWIDRGDTAAKQSASLLRRVAANQYQIEARKSQLLSDADPQKDAAALQSLYREQDALEAEKRGAASNASQADLNEIAPVGRVKSDLLDAHSALLAVAPGEHATYRWLITRNSVRLDVLPSPDELSHQLELLQHMLQQRRPPLNPGEDADDYAHRLGAREHQRDAILDRLGSQLLPNPASNIHFLYVAAGGDLQKIPWNALHTRCGSRSCFAVERYTLAIEPSASVAVALAHRVPKQKSARALVISDALPPDPRIIPRWRQLGPLPGSQREAEAIAHLLPSRYYRNLRRGEATAPNVRDALQSGFGLLHLAAHTLLVAGHPELSGVALSQRHSATNPGESVLWLHDIPRLNAPPLVVLSGCSTQGADVSGEELNTLTQAFFYAGAQQVVASNWQIDDDATVALMGFFYRNLVGRNMPAAEALRSAQLHMLSQRSDLADWAAFVVNGVSFRSTSLESARQ